MCYFLLTMQWKKLFDYYHLIMRKKKRNTKKRHILNWFPKPEIPNELSLMSIYELGWYILALVITVFLFIRWHKIPERNIDINLDRLNYHEDSVTWGTICDFDMIIPMTHNDFNSKSDIKFEFIPSKDTMDFKLFKIYKASPLKDTKSDSLLHVIDSTLNAKKVSRNHDLHLYRVKLIEDMEDFLSLKHYKNDTTRISTGGIVSKFSSNSYRKGLFLKYRYAEFVIPENATYSLHSYSDLGSTPTTKPRIYSLYDISQSYITLNFHTYSIDSINAVFDFAGATDFYEFDHPAFNKTASKIEYRFPFTDKDISIRLYLRFKDLENIQTVRVFFVTAILGGLVTIFFAFLIIYLYRLFSKRKNLPTNQEVNQNDTLE